MYVQRRGEFRLAREHASATTRPEYPSVEYSSSLVEVKEEFRLSISGRSSLLDGPYPVARRPLVIKSLP